MQPRPKCNERSRVVRLSGSVLTHYGDEEDIQTFGHLREMEGGRGWLGCYVSLSLSDLFIWPFH